MSSPLKQNTTTIQNLLNKINELPEASGGVELPELTNEGSASDLLSGKQLIDGDGNVVTGTIPTQVAKTIIPSTSSQIAVSSGVYATGAVTVAPIPSNYEDVAAETTEYTLLNAELEEVINSLPSAGSSGGGSVETCTINIEIDSDATLFDLAYSVLNVDGTITARLSNHNALTNSIITIYNVICGSLILIDWSGTSMGASYDLSTMVLRSDNIIDYKYWQAPLINDSVETIKLIGDD